jgi:hypothetical protein
MAITGINGLTQGALVEMKHLDERQEQAEVARVNAVRRRHHSG